MRTNKLVSLNKSQQGFIGVIFVAIALLAIVMVALGLMSRSSNGATTEQNSKTNAAILQKQTSDFKTGFDILTLKISPAAVTFDTDPVNGIFNPSQGAQYAVHHVPPSSATTSTGSPAYYLNKSVAIPGIGSTAPDIVAVLPEVTLEVCRQIHKALYNDASGVFASSAGTLTAWKTNAPVDDSASTNVAYLNHFEGCVKASGGEYIYYKALAEF